MAYCNNKAQEKARYLAVTEVRNGRSVAQVARRFGCFRSTVYRWIRKYESILSNYFTIIKKYRSKKNKQILLQKKYKFCIFFVIRESPPSFIKKREGIFKHTSQKNSKFQKIVNCQLSIVNCQLLSAYFSVSSPNLLAYIKVCIFFLPPCYNFVTVLLSPCYPVP